MIILTSMLKEPGELSKFQALYALYSGSMYAAAYKILNQAEDAEDAVQLSLIKVIRNLDRVSVTDLAAAISQLDQKYKDVLRLYYINELSSKEIGELLNLSQFTVNSRLQRARGKLGKIIKEREEGV